MAGSSIPDYPEELLCKGRQPDHNFSPDEELYCRVPAFLEGGRVSSTDIRCPDTSVNRSKYSKPEHVLYAKLPRFLDWKVAKFLVKDIPPSLKHPDGRQFEFSIHHDPIPNDDPMDDEDYAHCEIRAFLNHARQKRLPGIVQKLYRQTLADLMSQASDDQLSA